jgi:hypothetical protein
VLRSEGLDLVLEAKVRIMSRHEKPKRAWQFVALS